MIRTSGILLLPPLACGAAYLLTPAGSSAFGPGSIRAGTFLLVMLGALALPGRRPGRADLGAEAGMLLLSGAGAALLSGGWRAGLLAAATLWGVWGLSLPLRCAGLSGAARAGVLLGGAALAGTAYLLPPAVQQLPFWVGELNPLLHLHMAIHGEEWFHGPILYGRVGEHYYRTPDLALFLARAGIAGAAGFAAALGIGAVLRRRAPRPA